MSSVLKGVELIHFDHVKVMNGVLWTLIDNMQTLNMTHLSIQQLDNVNTLVMTPAIAAVNFLLMLLCFPSPPNKATGKLGLTK